MEDLWGMELVCNLSNHNGEVKKEEFRICGPASTATLEDSVGMTI